MAQSKLATERYRSRRIDPQQSVGTWTGSAAFALVTDNGCPDDHATRFSSTIAACRFEGRGCARAALRTVKTAATDVSALQGRAAGAAAHAHTIREKWRRRVLARLEN